MKTGQKLMFVIFLLWVVAVAFSCAEEDPQPTSALYLTAEKAVNKSCDPEFYAYLLQEKEWTEGVIRMYEFLDRPRQADPYRERLYYINTDIMVCGFNLE